MLRTDFSAVDLSIGSTYTVVLSRLGGLSQASYAATNILYAGSSSSNPNPYSGGQFYYAGSNYGNFLSDRDIAFRMTGASTTTDVPEPATWAMFIGGFGIVGAAMRRRQRVRVRFA